MLEIKKDIDQDAKRASSPLPPKRHSVLCVGRKESQARRHSAMAGQTPNRRPENELEVGLWQSEMLHVRHNRPFQNVETHP